jgi:putative RNA 2'-phosphotransferase
MSEDGYVFVTDLLTKLDIDMSDLEIIVNENNKQRFSFYDKEKILIRANQGHTIPGITIDFEKVTTGIITMYHGTSIKNIDSIKKQGLIPMNRLYVHLTDNLDVAKEVGLRYAKKKENLIIFECKSGALIGAGIDVYVSENGVYQVKQIPFNLLKQVNLK